MQNSISKNLTVVPTEITRNRCPKWERQLPSKLVIASAEDGSTSLKLKVELETTDTGEVKSINVMTLFSFDFLSLYFSFFYFTYS